VRPGTNSTTDSRSEHNGRRSAERLAELRERAYIVVVVSHSLDAIVGGCNRVIWLDEGRGRVRMDGDPEAVVSAYRNQSDG
jgi:ABC-type polysaccharide/polyol phosphate transport system ATPase subunit